MSSPGLSAFDDMLSPQMESAYKDLEEQNKLRTAALEKEYYAPQRAMWEKYAKALEARRAGPSSAETLLALGAALSQPTQYRGLGGMLANVTPVMAAQQKAAREAEEAKQDLLMKYGMETGKLGLEQKKAEIDAAQELAEARYKAIADRYKPVFVPGVGFVLPPSAGSVAPPRPANVPATFTHVTDTKTSKTGWISPDGKTFVPDVSGAK